MELNFYLKKHLLEFKFDAGTSRGVLKARDTYFILLENAKNKRIGVGEASPLKGLSIDYIPNLGEIISKYGEKFRAIPDFNHENEVLDFVAEVIPDRYPSVILGFETALLDLVNGGEKRIFKNDFFLGKQSISINGLVWMGEEAFMKRQIDQKLNEGFSCIKMKIGAIDFASEFNLLQSIRDKYSPNEITLRVDANGAFSLEEANQKLQLLANLDIHSIEQPIKQGQLKEMATLCKGPSIPIALDEELIGIYQIEEKKKLLANLQPQYIILKPTLLGGFRHTAEWINLAEQAGIGWWITSALESNIGLNAICQFVSNYQLMLPQGLGTGKLYHNNIISPLTIENGHVFYDITKDWQNAIIKK